MIDILKIGIFCLALLPSALHGQAYGPLDSLLAAYTQHTEPKAQLKTLSLLFNGVLYSEPDRARGFAQEALRISLSAQDTLGIAMSNYQLGVFHNNSGVVDSADHYYSLALDIYLRIGHTEGQAMVNHALAIMAYDHGDYPRALELIDDNIRIHSAEPQDPYRLATSYDLRGIIHQYLGNYTIALENCLKALAFHLDHDIGKPHRKADILNHLAGLELYLGHHQQSIEYNLEAIEIYQARGDKYFHAQAANDIGNALFYLKDYAQARQYLLQSIELAREVQAADILATALGNLAKVHREEKQYAQSLALLREAVEIVEKQKNTNKLIEALSETGKTYNAMNRPALAIPYLNRSASLADSIGVQDNLRQAYFNRSLSHELMGDFRRALDDYKQYDRVSDTVFNTIKSRQIEELLTIHETEKKERALLLQQQENELLKQEARISALQMRSLWIASALLLGIAVLVFIIYRQKTLRRQLLQEKEKKELAQELEFKKRELTTHTLHLVSKNKLLNQLKTSIERLKDDSEDKRRFNPLIGSIDEDLRGDADWEHFERYFREVYSDFDEKIKRAFSELTGHEIRLITLMKMNLSTKEIATILNITPDSVNKARYRLRKKLNLETDQNLQQFIMAL